MNRSAVRMLFAAASISLLLAGCSVTSPKLPIAATTQTHILKSTVLLTNDDGWDAPGLVALKKALVADGHSVVVVAPLHNESGTGASVTTKGTLTATHPSGDKDVFAVDGTPADSVMLALTGLGLAKPSLLISGINPGYNVGDDLNYSGTVGAAIVATLYGIPSIAVSAATTDASATVADFVVKFVDRLDTAASSTWPNGSVINVNYPASAAKTPTAVEFTTVADNRSLRAVYTHTTGDSYALSYVPDAKTAKGTDIAAVADNDVSVSAFTASRRSTVAEYKQLRSFVAGLKP